MKRPCVCANATLMTETSLKVSENQIVFTSDTLNKNKAKVLPEGEWDPKSDKEKLHRYTGKIFPLKLIE